MRLPGLPNRIQHRPVQTVQFLGLNLTNNTKDGEFADELGLTTTNYPYLTQIPQRSAVTGYTSPTDVYVWDGDLFVVDGTSLKKNGVSLGEVTAGVKQMAVINTKLVIFPDKKYVDLTTGTLSSLGSGIPDLDFICSCNNRIWGVSNSTKTIYASALGDPTDFTTYTTEAGAYAVAVGSEGDWTGICDYGGNVCCWKENILHKIMGSYPSEYYMIDSNIYGVQKGSEKSLVVINDMLYYKGVFGVYVYGGNQPQLISYNLGTGTFTEAVGGTDGRKYYLNMKNSSNVYKLYAYDLVHGLWMAEENGKMDAIANLNKTVYLLYNTGSSTSIKTIGTAVGSSQAWHGEFVPYTEEMFYRKGYLKILLRMDMTSGSSITVKVKEDNAAQFRTAYTRSTVNKSTVMIPLRLGRCDRFTLRLEGTGAVTVRTLGREHVTGSEIN